MNCNLGGFIPLSTVDWPGKAVCTVFFRGCPNVCPDCHNAGLRSGFSPIDLGDIALLIKESSPYISGVVFSGGEPTLQGSNLILLSGYAKILGLQVCLHTSGIFPHTLAYLIRYQLVDKIALDIKDSWVNYPKYLWGGIGVGGVKQSRELCSVAFSSGDLLNYEEVFTVFTYNIEALSEIASTSRCHIPLIVQQGHPVVSSGKALSREKLLEICGKNLVYKQEGCLRLRTDEHPEELIAYE